MNHPAELAINQYLEDATSGKSTMSEETVQQIGKDVMDAVRRQFGGGNRRDEFRLRMSNIGRPTCQFWFEKNIVLYNKYKSMDGEEALKSDNLICRTINEIKYKVPNIGIMTDVALDPYTSHGHDGILKEDKILNDGFCFII